MGMGNTCKPMAVSFQCMTKSTTIKKIIIIKKRQKNPQRCQSEKNNYRETKIKITPNFPLETMQAIRE